MGYAVAAEALERGHQVHLLSGPVCLAPPEGARVSAFESAEDLYELARGALDEADCLVMAAAVGDYRPAGRVTGKRKKTAELTLELVATRDVLRSLGEVKGGRVFVGFAVETEKPLENARRKLERKSLDMLVLNSPASFGADEADFTLVLPGGEGESLGRLSKARLAGIIIERVEKLFGGLHAL